MSWQSFGRAAFVEGHWPPTPPTELREKGPMLRQLNCRGVGPFSLNSWGV
jgi:hypothetical protein